MPVKHAASHGLATLLGLLLAGLLIGLVKQSLPSLVGAFSAVGERLAEGVNSWLDLDLTPGLLANALLATLLAAIWGAIWAFLHSERD